MADSVREFDWRYANDVFYLGWNNVSGITTLRFGASRTNYPEFAQCTNIGLVTTYSFTGGSDVYYVSIYGDTGTQVSRFKIYPPGLLTRGYQDMTVGPNAVMYIADISQLLKVQLSFDFCRIMQGILYTKEPYYRVRVYQ